MVTTICSNRKTKWSIKTFIIELLKLFLLFLKSIFFNVALKNSRPKFYTHIMGSPKKDIIIKVENLSIIQNNNVKLGGRVIIYQIYKSMLKYTTGRISQKNK